MTDEAIIAAADAAARRWAAPAPGSIRPGSELHKTTFSQLLLDTHNPYKPAVIEWPLCLKGILRPWYKTMRHEPFYFLYSPGS